MDNSNKFFYETEIEYNPLKEWEEWKAKVLDQYMKICTSAVSSLLDLETIDDNSGLPDQFLVSREAIQNSIDAISEKIHFEKYELK